MLAFILNVIVDQADRRQAVLLHDRTPLHFSLAAPNERPILLRCQKQNLLLPLRTQNTLPFVLLAHVRNKRLLGPLLDLLQSHESIHVQGLFELSDNLFQAFLFARVAFDGAALLPLQLLTVQVFTREHLPVVVEDWVGQAAQDPFMLQGFQGSHSLERVPLKAQAQEVEKLLVVAIWQQVLECSCTWLAFSAPGVGDYDGLTIFGVEKQVFARRDLQQVSWRQSF